VTIVTSRIENKITVLAVLENRKKDTIIDFFKSMPKALRKTITSVCSDLYDGFINGAREVLGEKIRIVIDRFHVAKLYREVVETVRKKEMKRLKKILSEEEYKKLKGLMWALRASKANLSDKYKAVLKIAFKYSPDLKKVYELSQKLTKIFNTETSRNGGIRLLKNWITKVQKSEIKLFDTFIGTLEKRMKEIANYFVFRENSGFVEGLNNRIKVLKRRAYGVVDRIHLFQRICLDLNRKDLVNHGRCRS